MDKNKFGFLKAEWEIMKKNDGRIIELEEERARKKAAVRERKKKPKMKVSGKSVFELRRIMGGRGKKRE